MSHHLVHSSHPNNLYSPHHPTIPLSQAEPPRSRIQQTGIKETRAMLLWFELRSLWVALFSVSGREQAFVPGQNNSMETRSFLTDATSKLKHRTGKKEKKMDEKDVAL